MNICIECRHYNFDILNSYKIGDRFLGINICGKLPAPSLGCDPVTGKKTFAKKDIKGKHLQQNRIPGLINFYCGNFEDNYYPYCEDINTDGNCAHFYPK
jgi:hypothetical protein